MANERKWHGHKYEWTAPLPERTEGAFACTCGHRVVVDDAVPEGEAKIVDGVTRVGLTTSEDLDRLGMGFRTSEFFPACPLERG